MGERPADPATRVGVGVGAGTDDAAEGSAEDQIERTGAGNDPSTTPPAAADLNPGGETVHFADTDAAASSMQPVDPWGTGDREQPQESPSEELENET
jgi:hypothetical protein